MSSAPASSTTPRELLRAAVADVRRAWRALLATDLVWKLVAFAILTPLVGLALRGGIALSGDTVLADQEILFFLLRPLGLVVLVVAAGLSLAVVGLEQASLIAIVTGAAADARGALEWAARRAAPTLGLTLQLVARALALAAPFLAGVGLVYFALLREHDINYYLRERPPVFWLAATAAAGLAGGLAFVLTRKIIGGSLSLPILLLEGATPRQALAESVARAAGARRTIRRALLLWAAGAALLSGVVSPLFVALARALLPYGRGNAGIVLALMVLLVVLWAVAGALATFLNASAFAALLVRLWAGAGGGRLEPGAAHGAAPAGGRRPLVRLAAALIAVLIAASVVGVVLVRGVRAQNPVVVIAHRGAAAVAPENTLAAVEAAIVQGADFVEIDVQETADGEIAVLHDSDLMKVAGVDLKIWDATWDELRTIDIGSWFAPEFAAERVPRLRDVLERARGRARVTIELKSYGHGRELERRVVELVDQLGVRHETIAMSLDYGIVRRVRELRPDWTVGLLTATAVGDLTGLEADFLAVNSGIADLRFVRRAHAKGKQVYVWTVNDPVRMFQMLNLGVDGLITDEPALARAVIARHASLGSIERLLVGLAFRLGAAAPDPPPSADGA
jgi:glycerophosphoryl diester phosphodiesterase